MKKKPIPLTVIGKRIEDATKMAILSGYTIIGNTEETLDSYSEDRITFLLENNIVYSWVIG